MNKRFQNAVHLLRGFLLLLCLKRSAVRGHTVENWVVEFPCETCFTSKDAWPHPARHLEVLIEVVLNRRSSKSESTTGLFKCDQRGSERAFTDEHLRQLVLAYLHSKQHFVNVGILCLEHAMDFIQNDNIRARFE